MMTTMSSTAMQVGRRYMTTMMKSKAIFNASSSLVPRTLLPAASVAVAPMSQDMSSLLTTTTSTTMTTKRQYRGDTGIESQSDKLSEQEQELIKIAKPKAEMIYERHIQLPQEDNVDVDSALTNRQKRLIYRSKQRGWLEVDLLLGTWASLNVPTLTPDELDQFEQFVNQETIDIYNIITLRVPVPDQLKSNDGSQSVVEQIQEWARSHPLGKADPELYTKVKTEHKLI